MDNHENDIKESRDLLYQAAFEFLTDKVKTDVPATGEFKKIGCWMKDPEDELICTLYVEPSYKEEENCCISMGCIFPGTDALCSNFVFWGNKQEIINWFADPANMEEAHNTYFALRNRCKKGDWR